MNGLTIERTMTVKEVADILGVGPEAIKWHIRKLFPHVIQNGKPTYLNETQVTEIKRKMIPTSQLVGVTTEMEMVEKTMEVMGWLKVKVDQLNKENQDLRSKAVVADTIANTEGLILPSDAGKQICGHPISFIHWLEDTGILFRRKSGGVLLPRAVFQERGYLTLKSKEDEGYLWEQTYFTPKGLSWICAKYCRAHNLLTFPVEAIGE